MIGKLYNKTSISEVLLYIKNKKNFGYIIIPGYRGIYLKVVYKEGKLHSITSASKIFPLKTFKNIFPFIIENQDTIIIFGQLYYSYKDSKKNASFYLFKHIKDQTIDTKSVKYWPWIAYSLQRPEVGFLASIMRYLPIVGLTYKKYIKEAIFIDRDSIINDVEGSRKIIAKKYKKYQASNLVISLIGIPMNLQAFQTIVNRQCYSYVFRINIFKERNSVVVKVDEVITVISKKNKVKYFALFKPINVNGSIVKKCQLYNKQARLVAGLKKVQVQVLNGSPVGYILDASKLAKVIPHEPIG